ncbi:tape measure protein [Secundilactobacillus oryzae]|uniref:tape measure protein n=1 Tax=Secundilactobacillus oryzae TaxID=1202668 RepID=UPI0006D20081|nr:tape measure protein [Secundilactobacillus oryzae]
MATGGGTLHNTIALPVKLDLNKLRNAKLLVDKINKSVTSANKSLESMVKQLDKVSNQLYRVADHAEDMSTKYQRNIAGMSSANQVAAKSAKEYAQAAEQAGRKVVQSNSGADKPINQTREAYRKATQETKLFGRAQRSISGSTGGLGKSRTQVERYGNSVASATKKTHKFKSIMLGVVGGAIGFSGLNTISGGIRSMISELDESSKAWQTFEGNLKMNGYSDKRIKKVQGDLQKFAQQTIYSASDMASTYSQLDAVGVKDTERLVKGFGGLAAAADDPAQAMKSLSQQAVQMAAKPKVQWQDLRIMMEQAPAGISAVAKAMHTTTGGLIRDVQAGKISSKEFLDMIGKVGTNKNFAKMATQYKTVGQAMDGLRETAANKLQKTYNKLGKAGIGAVSGITDAIGKVDEDKLAKAIQPTIDNMESYVKFMIKKMDRRLVPFLVP